MPARFSDHLGSRVSYWTPYAEPRLLALEAKAGHEVIARIAPGSTRQAVAQELQAVLNSLSLDGRPLIEDVKTKIVGDSARALQLLFIAVAVVLLMACANLTQLLLARSDRRTAEFAVRKALGATSARLLRLALIESFILSTAGGAAGAALATLALPAALALAPAELPRISEAAIDGTALAWTTGLVVLAACLVGLAPSLQLARLPVIAAIKRSPAAATLSAARFRSALIVFQVAASVALCTLAGLIGQSFLRLLPSEPGFEADARTVQYVLLPTQIYPETAARKQKWRTLLDRLQAAPGIDDVALGTNVPFGGDDGFRAVHLLDAPDETSLEADVRAVTPNYFRLLQMPLVQGRAFTADDHGDASGVAVVNQTFAQKIAPDGQVLGRTVGRIRGRPALDEYRIVGVVADSRSSGATSEPWDELYIPHEQSDANSGYVIVRSPLDPAAVVPLLRAELTAWAPEIPEIPWLPPTPLRELIRRELAGPTFSAVLITLFSISAVLLAAVGVFGLVAYSVSQRRKEMSIRAALGAQRGDLLSKTLRPTVALTAAGVLIGSASAVALAGFIESRLYGIAALDAPTFLGAASIMLAVSLTAAYLPARQAAQADPIQALRDP